VVFRSRISDPRNLKLRELQLGFGCESLVVMMMMVMMILFLIRMLLLFCPLSSSSSPQAIPRTLALDSKTGINLIQWPIEEVNALRMGQVSKTDVKLDAGAVVQVEGAAGGQVRERERERESTHKVLQIGELLSLYADSCECSSVALAKLSLPLFSQKITIAKSLAKLALPLIDCSCFVHSFEEAHGY
jgi:hypothetical protein